MKAGARALGVAFSGDDADARLATCAAVVRADRVVDGLALDARAVRDGAATAAVSSLLDRVDRPDATHVLVAGVAPAWFDVLALEAIHDAAGRPVLAVSFEASPGLGDAIDREFSGDAHESRRARYDALPPRRRVETAETRLFVRAVGCPSDEAARVVRAHTPEGQGRPEPLRVARLAARAGRALDAGDR
ncbi:MAG: DUF99 family protein [Haloferacaceae archaeon]